MTLQALNQLYYLKREIEMDTRRLQALNARIPRKREAQVIHEDIYRIIEAKRQRCIAELVSLEQYIAEIEDDFTKQIFVYRFVHGLPWAQVAARLGNWNTPENLRMIASRYIQKTNRALKSAKQTVTQ